MLSLHQNLCILSPDSRLASGKLHIHAEVGRVLRYLGYNTQLFNLPMVAGVRGQGVAGQEV